ncbi:redoxin domain-containing protein [Rossellomorea vietnamensis]|uniref:TlpA family protein disulfide reductase n=1 Tax=Rossellomorea vietnamensis TaxID=218284 RepID=UPI003D26DE16
MITNILLTVNLFILLSALVIIFYMLKYNSNFLKQIQSIKGIQFDTLAIGEKAPAFRLNDYMGNKIITKDLFYSKNTLMLFINTKCPTCKQLLKHFNVITNTYDINILIVNTDEVFDDSEIINLLPKSARYIRSSQVATNYFIYTAPTAALIENGNVKILNKVQHYNELFNMLISEKNKLVS